MTLGTILGASFRVLRRNPRPTVGPSLVINLGVLVIVAVATGLIGSWAIARVESAATQEAADALAAGSIAFGLVGLLLVMLLTLVGTSVLQGIIIAEVARGTVGERLRFGELWAILRGRVGALVGWGLLLGAAIGAAMLIGFGVLVGLVAAMGLVLGDGGVGAVGGVVIGSMVVLVGGLGTLLLVLWLSTRFAFVSSAIVLERLGVLAAMRRSWRLITGRFWRTLGITLLVLVIIGVASQIVATPVSLVGGIVIGLLFPTGTPDATGFLLVGAVYLVTFLVSTVISAIGLVVQSATAGLLYIDARMRAEGLDLELARYVEARQAGAPVPDPYAPRAGA